MQYLSSAKDRFFEGYLQLIVKLTDTEASVAFLEVIHPQ